MAYARYVYTEAGGEGGQCRIGAGKGGCNDADGKEYQYGESQMAFRRKQGSISSPAAGRGMFSCEANNNSRIPSDRNRKLTGTNEMP